jgi:hypothetical protein
VVGNELRKRQAGMIWWRYQAVPLVPARNINVRNVALPCEPESLRCLFTMRIIPAKAYNPGDRIEIAKEELIENLTFKVHKFNNRPKPTDIRRIVFFPVFSEFGSEVVSVLYCIPHFLRTYYVGYYSIAVGWAGRAFLYKHLVDEFWELDETYSWLRDYCRAFHHDSFNLRKLEKQLTKQGKFVHYNDFSKFVLSDLFKNFKDNKRNAYWPTIDSSKLDTIEKYIKKPAVGIIARNRVTYGRNLSIDFYKDLIKLLEFLGYNPVWLGEKVTTYPCPVDHIVNFRDSPDAKDLEKTLLLVSQLEFTVQFWTASTRLAGLTGTPFIIFESPEQVYSGGASGQEGIRLELCSKGPKKLVVSHFKNVEVNPDGGLALVQQAIEEMRKNNYSDIIGLVEDKNLVKLMQQGSHK